MAESSCIFCKIVAGQIPSYKVFESDDVFAFLDINPVSRGHALVVPKQHRETLDQCDATLAAKTFAAIPAIAKAVCAEAGTTDFNLLQNNGKYAGQEVPHVHFHIIPRFNQDSIKPAIATVFHQAKPASATYTDPKAFAAAVAAKISA